MTATVTVTADDVRTAARRLAGILGPTPAIWSDARGGWLKLESLQVTGSFKVRGAANAVAAQVERGDRRPIVAASAGNHAQGVAWAARRFGLAAHVVVPTSAPRRKVAGCRALGAAVVERGASFEEAFDHAVELAAREGWRFLHAFDDPDVVAGQGTVALELSTLEPDVVLIPIGGGSLAAGMGVVLAERSIRAVGVQVEGVDAMARELRGAGGPFEPAATLADGLRVRRPGVLNRDLCGRVLEDIVTVPEAQVRSALVDLIAADRIAAEGAGAVAACALPLVRGRRKVAVVSGGNVDEAVLASLFAERARCA
jgi:threonine dehydratase